jgi:hypothetical protein
MLCLVTHFLTFCGAAKATQVHPDVCPQDCSYVSIQAAIDASPASGTVVVGPGYYRERINFRGKALTLKSSDPADPAVVAGTIIDGGGIGSTVSIVSGEGRGAILEGITVTNGSGTSQQGRSWGGGILIVNSTPVIRNCVIKGNRADMGGGISITAGVVPPLVENCRIEDNTATVDGGGLFSMAAEIRGCLFVRNVANYSGGGAFCLGNTSLDSCRFEGNTAKSNGGGVFLEGMTTGGHLDASIMDNNTAGLFGGGLAVKECSPAVTNCLVTNNKAFGGGGVAVFGERAKPLLVNCTITSNTAGDGGGLFSRYAHPAALNTVVWGNDSTRPNSGEVGLEGGTLTADHCDIRGGWEGPGIIDADPNFSGKEPQPHGLASGSPCIDSGSETGAPATDLAGVVRPQAGPKGGPARTDIGAYEYAVDGGGGR